MCRSAEGLSRRRFSAATLRIGRSLVGYALAVIVGASVLVGFLAGLLTFKRSSRWCPLCGTTLSCASCPGRPTPSEARRSCTSTREGSRS